MLSSAISKREMGEILTAKVSCLFFFFQLGKNKIKKFSGARSQNVADAKTFCGTQHKSWQSRCAVSVSRLPFQAWKSQTFSNPRMSEGQRKKMWGRNRRNKILPKISGLTTFRHQGWRKERWLPSPRPCTPGGQLQVGRQGRRPGSGPLSAR